jgi:hypothetical protein
LPSISAARRAVIKSPSYRWLAPPAADQAGCQAVYLCVASAGRERRLLPPGGHIWQGAHPRGSHSVKSPFRSRISRTPGPIDRVHSFSSS